MHLLPVASWDRKDATQASPGHKLKADGSKLTAYSLYAGQFHRNLLSAPRRAKFADLRLAELRRICSTRNSQNFSFPRTTLNRGALTAAVPWHILPLEKAIEETTR